MTIGSKGIGQFFKIFFSNEVNDHDHLHPALFPCV